MEPVSNNVIKIAETLNSLALPALEERPSATPQTARKWRLTLGLTILLAGSAVASVLIWNKIQPDFGTWADTLPWTSKTPTTGLKDSPKAQAVQSSSLPAPSVQLAPMADEITGSGYVIAPATAILYAQRTDRIIAVHVNVGDLVTVDQPLVELEGTSQRLALERANMAEAASELDVKTRAIELVQAQTDYDRRLQLAAKGVATQSQTQDARVARDKASVNLDRAKQQLAQSKLDIKVAQDAVEKLIVRAPFTGTVSDIAARVSTMAFEPGTKEPGEGRLMTVIDTANLVIDADFAERNLAIFQQPVAAEAVLDAYPNRPFSIELERIATVASSQKGTITIRFRISDPPVGIRPNMAVRIRVTAAESAIASRKK